MRKMKKRIVSTVLGLLTAVSLLQVPAFAAGKIDTDRDCELVVQYQYEKKALANVEFELYHVADISAYAEFTLKEAFKQYPVEIGSYSGESWNELASTLDSYIAKDAKKPEGPKPVDSGKTDQNGMLAFPNSMESMKPGLYLVIGDAYKTNSYTYKCDPAIVCVPGADKENNDWDYAVNIIPKVSRKAVPDDDDGTVTRKVIKSWNDDGFEEFRPDSVEVTLLKNGDEYETVTLSAANNWSHVWKGLDKDDTWKVTEDVPEGYKVAITRQGNSFVVENSYSPTVTITDGETPLGNLPTGVLGVVDVLPQTGTTWWLAVVLAGIGLLFVALGLFTDKKSQ